METELITLVLATLLGGGSVGRLWLKSRTRWHEEQLSESRKILIDNDSQHRKLNKVLDNQEEILHRLEDLERKLPERSRKQKNRNKEA